ncbi:MAG: hypothetical protein QXU01_04095 [Candidatus Hadarchaeales archaeon]
MRQDAGIVILSMILPVVILAGLFQGVEDLSAKVLALLLPAVVSGGIALLMVAATRRQK